VREEWFIPLQPKKFSGMKFRHIKKEERYGKG